MEELLVFLLFCHGAEDRHRHHEEEDQEGVEDSAVDGHLVALEDQVESDAPLIHIDLVLYRGRGHQGVTEVILDLCQDRDRDRDQRRDMEVVDDVGEVQAIAVIAAMMIRVGA